MSDTDFVNELKRITGDKCVKEQEPMREHTTFRIGGPAQYFAIPETREQVRQLTGCCREWGMPYYIIGNGSNLLVGDDGVSGVVIQIYKAMSEIHADGETIYVQAGALLSGIANYAAQAGLGGFEFASGIPGTIGGACVMNAGAYGKEMKDVLKEVTVLTQEGKFLTIPAEELELGYRSSIIMKENYIVTDVTLRLHRKPEDEIRAQMEELRKKRVSKQPLEYPSAGSTFKRPEGYFAGKLIQDSGLRGFQVGGAQVSEKHCGFVINKDQATAKDVMELMRQVSERVQERFGVALEPEVKCVGKFR